MIKRGNIMYLDFYGLREYPFNVTSDPSFLYLSHSHREAFDHIIFGIEHKKGFIGITGEIGAGKTTLCRALLNKINPNVKTALIFNPTLPETQLLEAIVRDFGIKPKSKNKVSLLKELNTFLLQQLEEGNNAVLIIDEAQNLRPPTLEAIRMLSNLETEKEKLLQIVLVGQPQLRDKLDAPNMVQLRQRMAVRFHLNALSRDEVRSYINHRLSVAGSDGSIFFNDDAIEPIYSYSGGIPRVINLLCDKSLLLGFTRDTHNIERWMVDKSIKEMEGQYTLTGS